MAGKPSTRDEASGVTGAIADEGQESILPARHDNLSGLARRHRSSVVSQDFDMDAPLGHDEWPTVATHPDRPGLMESIDIDDRTVISVLECLPMGLGQRHCPAHESQRPEPRNECRIEQLLEARGVA